MEKNLKNSLVYHVPPRVNNSNTSIRCTYCAGASMVGREKLGAWIQSLLFGGGPKICVGGPTS